MAKTLVINATEVVEVTYSLRCDKEFLTGLEECLKGYVEDSGEEVEIPEITEEIIAEAIAWSKCKTGLEHQDLLDSLLYYDRVGALIMDYIREEIYECGEREVNDQDTQYAEISIE